MTRYNRGMNRIGAVKRSKFAEPDENEYPQSHRVVEAGFSKSQEGHFIVAEYHVLQFSSST